ncbi:MAG: BNR repeat-containing protein [Phycisphaerales bacterium]|nr:MAG: BNR repeat-containing protein [Phycisphaerales bacterium]
MAYGLLVFLSAPACDGARAVSAQDVLDISTVWSGHPVGFSLLTDGDGQYVAFYDQERRMTVARRRLDERRWQFKQLDSVLGWDSHNYVTMALDEQGHLHISGNMHVGPLVYFRTEHAGDIQSLQGIPAMVGVLENRCTYPRFMKGAAGELIFTYRDGASGRGNQIYNVYDWRRRTWRRLLDTPLLDGRGAMNAYPVGPTRGPDGFFHLCWVWRDTPDCSTNHDVSYARSRDLVHWETAGGLPVDLPMTIETKGVVVDPVPAGGGSINGNTRVGFDSEKRPIVTYHKFDAQGNTQIYNARYEGTDWHIYQVSDWDYRWDFQGGGSIEFEVRVSAVRAHTDGSLTQKYSRKEYRAGVWTLDEATLRPVAETAQRPRWPAALARPESGFPGMTVRWCHDSGGSSEPGVRYVLRWETLGPNRDRARDVAPPASMLRLYRLSD